MASIPFRARGAAPISRMAASALAGALLALLVAPALAATEPGIAPRDTGAIQVAFVTDEAEAVLRLLRSPAPAGPAAGADWERLWSSDGYRRLAKRERSMGRAFTDSAFATFVRADSTRAKAGALERTLRAWSAADVTGAGKRALAYLPQGAHIRAKVYLLIKPVPNSFVFETHTDPAILLYLDPAVTPAKLENTVAHELHHIGYSGACDAPEDTTLAPGVREARRWLSAFGEGLAMLAAAGGPDHHPHEVSTPEERARWDRDMTHADEDLATLDRFFLDLVDGRLADPDSIRAKAMTFFGVQGPWYTVGYRMASLVESVEGKDALVASICDPVALLEAWNRINDPAALCRPAPTRWSPELLAKLRGRGAPPAAPRGSR